MSTRINAFFCLLCGQRSFTVRLLQSGAHSLYCQRPQSPAKLQGPKKNRPQWHQGAQQKRLYANSLGLLRPSYQWRGSDASSQRVRHSDLASKDHAYLLPPRHSARLASAGSTVDATCCALAAWEPERERWWYKLSAFLHHCFDFRGQLSPIRCAHRTIGL